MIRPRRLVVVLALLAGAIAACDRVVDLSPPPDARIRDGAFLPDAGSAHLDGGNDGGGALPDAFVPLG